MQQLLSRAAFEDRFGHLPLFGMVHLPPLPGSPLFTSMESVIDTALDDAEAIERGGAAAIVIENFGDRPFFKRVGNETVAALTRAATEIRRQTKLPIGINILRNDGEAAIAVAAAVGASFIRVNILTGAMLTDQGLIESDAAAVLRARAFLAPDVCIFADHMVKHATSLTTIDERQWAKDLRFRSHADVIVVSGKETGGEADAARIELLREVTDAPIVIGSGLTVENAATFNEIVDGAIVGTSIKRNGELDQPVDSSRLRAVVEAFSRR